MKSFSSRFWARSVCDKSRFLASGRANDHQDTWGLLQGSAYDSRLDPISKTKAGFLGLSLAGPCPRLRLSSHSLSNPTFISGHLSGQEGGPCPRLKVECHSIFKPATQFESSL